MQGQSRCRVLQPRAWKSCPLQLCSQYALISDACCVKAPVVGRACLASVLDALEALSRRTLTSRASGNASEHDSAPAAHGINTSTAGAEFGVTDATQGLQCQRRPSCGTTAVIKSCVASHVDAACDGLQVPQAPTTPRRAEVQQQASGQACEGMTVTLPCPAGRQLHNKDLDTTPRLVRLALLLDFNFCT